MNQVVLASSQPNHAPRAHDLSRHSKQPYGSNSSRPPSHRASCRVLDSQRQTMDMYYEPRPRRQHRRPRKTLRFLDEDDVISYRPREYHVAGAALISRHELPNGRPRWSCQPCAQQALNYIRNGHMIQIPADIESIDECCLYASDTGLPCCAREKVKQRQYGAYDGRYRIVDAAQIKSAALHRTRNRCGASSELAQIVKPRETLQRR
ncbi:hypothetical protein S7711_10604 [Stachybotrys chartarum IBT 7711]|uniref:Uncharacterized protein n=1 Tax=Stachybotrys chartarum (strain CBS 109288 / IBT 7711) TaxID=1280523 RepID=A0A084AYX8_STACB|nr:hypothetical protein S7711_10604 [Stachybotrys chartarum IBT 7711]KFA79824.1 hypothetical protein S40288_10508 [Stachybotrys chartarum IBT 40288]